MTYVSGEDLKRELPFGAADFGIDDTTEDADGNTNWDNLLADLQGRETEWLEDQLGTTFQLTTATESLSRPAHADARHLPLPKRPIADVNSVTIDGDTLSGGNYAVEDTHLVLLDGASRRKWPTDYGAVDVEWTYGYDGAPGPVRDAIVQLVRNALERIKTDGLETEATGDGASYSYRLPADVRAAAKATASEYEAPSYYGGAGVL